MPYPAHWPAAGYSDLDALLNPASADPTSAQIAQLAGSGKALADAAQAHGAQPAQYQVAELDRNSAVMGYIATEVGTGLGHSAGYTQDKYAPARMVKNTAPSPGGTDTKHFWEWIGLNRLSVKPGDWAPLKVLVCKNDARWRKFETARQNLAKNRVNTATKFGPTLFGAGALQMTWAKAPGQDANFPLIDATCGEAWLWNGQPFDVYQGILQNGFQRLHCASNADTGYGALGRGNYFTDKFSKALLYSLNLRNQYPGAAKGSDTRVVMLSRVLLGRVNTIDGQSEAARRLQRFAHNLELTTEAKDVRSIKSGRKDWREDKLNEPARAKGWNQNYRIAGADIDENLSYDSIHTQHKGSNEFLVASGKQCYPEFLVFVKKV